MAARQTDLRLYLDVIPDPSKVPSGLQPQLSLTSAQPELPQGTSMIFLKHFDTSKQTLHGIGKCYAQRNAKISDLVPTINERMRWTPGTPLKLYEEIKPGMIELMKPKLTFSQSEIQDGDVICFQVDLCEKE